MGRFILATMATTATLIASAMLFYAGTLFLFAAGVTGDVSYDNNRWTVLLLAGVISLPAALFAWLSVLLWRATLSTRATRS